jgi:hypothetical protein
MLEPRSGSPDEFRLLGQVGQESNLQPVVLEFAWVGVSVGVKLACATLANQTLSGE